MIKWLKEFFKNPDCDCKRYCGAGDPTGNARSIKMCETRIERMSKTVPPPIIRATLPKTCQCKDTK